jgi:hypothetical protein
MKVDKEFLLKHHFWILAGLVLPLELFAFIWLSTSVAGDNDKDRDTIEKAKKDLAAQNDIKNDNFLKALQKKDKVLATQKGVVWKKAWDKQYTIFNWPPLDGHEGALDKASFGDPIDNVTCSIFERTYSDYVAKVYDNLIAPTEYVGADGSWRGLLRYVPEWKDRPVDSEDLWLSMEDIWVQRELLNVIVETNKVAATFASVEPPKKDADVPAGAKSFQSPYWRIDLWLVEGKLHGKITNVSTRRQALDADFDVKVHETGRPTRIHVNFKPRAVNESFKFERDLRASNPAGVYDIVQVLDLRTVPVKRVTALKMGREGNSDRKSHYGMKARPQNAPAPAAGSDTVATPPAPPGPLSKNGLERDRYIDVTPQVRRTPVAMVVIIDQNFMQDLLRAFANSKLRIQTTLMHWQHIQERQQAGAGFLGGGSVAPQDEDTGLVELGVYGIASLYERPK